jgi:phosphoribosylformylglycinamidine cyclo-ligase
MHRVFNCGIGMVIVVAAADAERTVAHLNGAGERAWVAGHVRARRDTEHQTVVT